MNVSLNTMPGMIFKSSGRNLPLPASHQFLNGKIDSACAILAQALLCMFRQVLIYAWGILVFLP